MRRSISDTISCRETLYFTVFLGFVLAGIFLPSMFQKEMLALGDVPDQFLPWRIHTRSALSDGYLPFWNPFSFCGAPFLANMQSAVLYPVDRILDLFLPPAQALTAGVLVHLWLAGVGVFLFAGCFQVHSLSAAVCACGYALGGFHAIHLLGGNLLTIQSSVFLPWHLFFLEKIKRCCESKLPVTGWILGSSLFATLQVLSGHAQLLFYSLLFVLLYFIALFCLSQANKWKLLLWVSLVGGLALLLSAPQWMPTMEYLQYCSRQDRLPYETATEFSLGWEVLLTFFLPEYLGTHADQYTGLLKDTFWGNWKNWSAVYMGILATTGFLIYVRRVPTVYRKISIKQHIPLLFLMAVSLFLALGRNNPLYGFLHEASFLGQFRAPSKFLPGFLLAFCILSSMGLSTLFSKNNQQEPGKKNNPYLFVAMMVMGVLLYFVSLLLFTRSSPYPVTLIIRDILRSLGLVVILSGIYLWRCSNLFHGCNTGWSISRWGWKFMLIGVLLLDLVPYFQKYVVTRPLEKVVVFPWSWLQEVVPAMERIQATSEIPQSTWGMVGRIPMTGGYDPLQLDAYVDHFRKTGDLAANEIPDAWTPPISAAEMLGAKWLLSTSAISHPTLIPHISRFPWYLYQTRHPFSFVEFVPDDNSSVAELNFDWQKGNLLIKGETQSAGRILIRQVYTPGWECFRKGGTETIPINKEPPFWQSIQVGKGTLDLVLVYRPTTWSWSLWAFLIGLFIFLFIFIIWWRNSGSFKGRLSGD